MSIWAKIGIIIAIIGAIALAIFIGKTQYDLNKRLEETQRSMLEMKQLGDGIVRSQAQYVSKDDLDRFGKDLKINLDLIKKDLASLGATVEGINSVVVSTAGYHGTGLGSSHTVPRLADLGNDNGFEPLPASQDPFGYLSNAQTYVLNEPIDDKTSVPFGATTFKAWQAKPWDVDVYPRKYNVTTVIGQDADGKQYTYNKFTIESRNKTYDVKITNSKFEQQMPENHFAFNPKVGIGIAAGGNITKLSGSISPTAYVSFVSYGKTKPKPTFLVGVAGVGWDSFSKTGNVSLSPGAWNIGSVTSIINNTYLSPVITFGFDKSISVGASAFVTF